MEITIVQALLVAVFSAVCMAGNLIGIYTNRCIVMATGVGIILGDPTTGLAIGANSPIAPVYLRVVLHLLTTSDLVLLVQLSQSQLVLIQQQLSFLLTQLVSW